MRILIALLLSFVTVAHAEDRGLLPGLISTPMLLPVSVSGRDVMLDSYVVCPDRPGPAGQPAICMPSASASSKTERRDKEQQQPHVALR